MLNAGALQVTVDADTRPAEGKLKSFGDGMGSMLGGAAKIAGAAIAGVGVAAVAASIDGLRAFDKFEQGMNEVFTLIPSAGQEMFDDLSSGVKDFSKEFGVLPDKVIPALYQSLSAGVPPDNVFTFLETAQKAAKGGVTDLETAVNGITSVVNAYGEEMVNAGEASDLMFTAVRLGKTDFGQLSASLFNVIPTAASLGIEFGDVTAALARLTAQGTPTSVATTQLRQAFQEAAKSGGKLDGALKDLHGKSFPELIAGGMDIGTIFDSLRQSMPDEDFRNLFGSVEALSGVLGITGPQAQAFQDALAEMGGSAGATDAAFQQMDKGLGPVMDRLKASLAVARIELGERLAPYAERFLNFILTVGVPALLTFAGILQGPLTTAFTLIRDAFITFVQALQGNWSDNEQIHGFHRIIGNIALVIREQVIPAVQAFAGFITGTVWPAIQQGIAVVGSLISAFNEGGFAGVFQRIGDAVLAAAPVILGKLLELVTAIGGWVINTGLPFIAGKLGEWADAFGAWAQAAVPPMLEKLGVLLGVLGNWFADTGLPLLLQKLGEWGQALIGWIGPRIIPVLTALGELLLAIGTWLGTVALPAIAAKLAEWGQQFIDWIGPRIGPMLSEMWRLLGELTGWMIGTALPAIWAQLQAWGQSLVDWVQPRIMPLLGELGSLLARVGAWIVTEALPAIVTNLVQWGLAFTEWVAKDALPYLVPRLWAFGERLLAWITSEALPAIITKLAEWGQAFLGWIAKDVLPFLAERLGALLVAIGGWITGTAVPWMIREAAAIGRALGQGLVDGIKSMFGTVFEAAKDLGKSAIDGLKFWEGSPWPSAIQSGRMFGWGFAIGIDEASPVVWKKAWWMGFRAGESVDEGHKAWVGQNFSRPWNVPAGDPGAYPGSGFSRPWNVPAPPYVDDFYTGTSSGSGPGTAMREGAPIGSGPPPINVIVKIGEHEVRDVVTTALGNSGRSVL